nr:glycosyltransferase [Adlercreutzia sp. JBNU-10]
MTSKKKYVQISTHADGWGKTILFDKHEELRSDGVESYVFWARGDHEQDNYMRKIASLSESCIDAVLTKLDGKAGFHSKRQTKRLLRMLDEIDPDVVHLHVLIGYYLDVEQLFSWLARSRCQVIWTLHDCWAFTGHCIHFSSANCNRWKTGCTSECPQINSYPKTLNRHTISWNYQKKKEVFTQLPVDRMKLVTPSKWLRDLASESFLAKYSIDVVPNTIDREVFKPVTTDFKSNYGIEGRYAILGVSSAWSEKKGLQDFIRLSEEVDESHVIVLVGLTSNQIRRLGRRQNSKLLLLPKTKSIEELVSIYSGVDVFFNPTKEDTFPTVNLEAEACGLPVVTYDAGGCRETIRRDDSACVDNYEEAVRQIAKHKGQATLQ